MSMKVHPPTHASSMSMPLFPLSTCSALEVSVSFCVTRPWSQRVFITPVGPSSSHTVGPMRAANIFINDLADMGLLEKVKNIKITL